MSFFEKQEEMMESGSISNFKRVLSFTRHSQSIVNCETDSPLFAFDVDIISSFINHSENISDISLSQPKRKPFTDILDGVYQNHSQSNLRFNIGRAQRFNCLPLLGGSRVPIVTRVERISMIPVQEDHMLSPLLEYDFDLIRSDLITTLREKLMHDRYFSIHELYKEYYGDKKVLSHGYEDVLPLHIILGSKANLENIGQEKFMEICTREKDVSRSLQSYLSSAPEKDISSMLALIKKNIPLLIRSQYGNYVLQIAANRDESTLKLLEKTVNEDIGYYIKDEFASRVMQIIAEKSSAFRMKIFDWFENHLEELVNNPPGIFLLISAFSSTKNPTEFKNFSERLKNKNLRRKLSEKNFKRILISYIENCCDEDIDSICKTYRIKNKFTTFLDDKYGALLLVAIINRENSTITSKFISLLQKDLLNLLQTKFFKLMFFKLSQPTSPSYLVKKMQGSLISMPAELFAKVTSSKTSRYFYCFLLVMTLDASSQEILDKIVSAIDDNDRLHSILRGIEIPTS